MKKFSLTLTAAILASLLATTTAFAQAEPLTPTQLAQLGHICDHLLARLDPDGRMLAAIP